LRHGDSAKDRSLALEVLPPTITDVDSFALVREILRMRPSQQETSALRVRLFGSGISWQGLVDFANGHAILPPCVFALSERALLLPLPRSAPAEGGASGAARTHVTRALADVYARHLERRAALHGQLVEVVAALNRAGIAPLIIKGARYLTQDCPPWAQARGMRDLDILLPHERGAAAVSALQAGGYTPARGGAPTDQHLPEMQCAGRPSWVELHTEGLGYLGRRLLSTDRLWAVSLPGQLEKLDLRVLPPAWHLLHALLHHQVSDHGYPRRLLAIKDVWEFACLAEGLSPADWEAITDHMRNVGAADILGSFIAQAELLFGFAPPAAVVPSPKARAHAEATLRRAQSPTWLRRLLFTADKLGFAFAPDTLAARYPRSGGNPLGAAGRHIGFLIRLHGGETLRRWRDGGT
jgi:hypothetical protein